jgi:hypothetical protein
MYTTKEIEQAVMRKGYELERIYYNKDRRVRKAIGFVFEKGRTYSVLWDGNGKVLRATCLNSGFDLPVSSCCLDEEIDRINELHENGALDRKTKTGGV